MAFQKWSFHANSPKILKKEFHSSVVLTKNTRIFFFHTENAQIQTRGTDLGGRRDATSLFYSGSRKQNQQQLKIDVLEEKAQISTEAIFMAPQRPNKSFEE